MEPLPTKSVIIHRDEDGFGLRVGGQNPVFVDCVHENGAAWKAGVRKNDRIIKVNGTLVRSYDHQRVVQMIQNCTPFVNLTLHSPAPMAVDPFPDKISNSIKSGIGRHMSLSNNNLSLSGNSLVPSTMQIHRIHQNSHHHHVNHHHPSSHIHHQRRHYTHPHSMSSNLNWLLDISDDLFQDNKQHQEQQQQAVNHEVGVSKLIVSGPNPLTSSMSSSKLEHKRQMQQQHTNNTGDNPYYYYKTAPEKACETPSCNSSTTSLLSNQLEQQASKAMVRSRSSTKMSTRSIGGKYKARNLRSRLVDDLRSLTITTQTTPASLSTSPSSSDLSDCDDVDPTRLDCLTLSNSPNSATCLSNASAIIKSKATTRRFEIIRELVDTEKTHTEKLKQLNDLLYKPIKAENLVPPDQLKMVFSCHKTLFKIHRQIYKKLVAAQKNISEYHQEPLVGKTLLEIFDGELGRRLDEAASLFCACQSTNTEVLNRITRKDTKSGEFLAQVANQQMLGRLGIKDLLASCFQRLTKYPLLLDNLLKATPYAGSSGMIHSKSLSEGAIAICPSSSLNSNDHTGHKNNITSATNEMSSSRATHQKHEGDEDGQELDENPIQRPSRTVHSNILASVFEKVIDDDDDDDDIDLGETLIQSDAITTTSPPETATSEIVATSATALTTSTGINDTSAISIGSTKSDEYAYERVCIDRALHMSRQILIHVNEAVSRAIAQSKLKEVWRKTDKNPALPVIDIDTQQLLHEGSLTLRLAHRSFEVYVILLTHYLIILTREGQEKYKLKYFTDGKSPTQFSPVFNIDEHLVIRDSATDENGFYLLSKRKDDERMYEFGSQSPAERAKWKEKIHMSQLYNFATVPDDDNTLTRYRELISLATSSNTPNNIEHSPTNNNIVAAYSAQ